MSIFENFKKIISQFQGSDEVSKEPEYQYPYQKPSAHTPRNYEELHQLDAAKNEQNIHTEISVDTERHEITTITYEDDNSIISIKSEPDDFITEFFRLSDFIGSGKNSVKDRLAACEKALEMLPEFCRLELKDCDGLPPCINCRDFGVELYLRLGDWENAQRVISTCIDAKAYDQEEGEIMQEYLRSYRKVAEAALSYIAEHPGCLQKDMYKILNFEGEDRGELEHFLRCSLQIQKEKFNRTNKLFINTDTIV